MKCFALLLLTVFLTHQASAEKDSLSENLHYKTYLKIAAGAGALGFQFIGVPLIDQKYNYQKPMNWDNPFKYVKNVEPFLEDELWHLVGSSTSYQMNYAIFKNLFGIKNPVITTAVVNFSLWSGMECLDGLMSTGFQVTDEFCNALGTTLGVIRILKPDFPVYVRLGVKNWSELMKATSTGSRSYFVGHMYDFMKVDFIYMFPSHIYTGVSISRKAETKKDLPGITAGMDLGKFLVPRINGFFKGPLEFLSNNVSPSVSFTVWLK